MTNRERRAEIIAALAEWQSKFREINERIKALEKHKSDLWNECPTLWSQLRAIPENDEEWKEVSR